MGDQFHQAHETGAPFVTEMTEVFLEHRGTHIDLPITYEGVVAFIDSYEAAILGLFDVLGKCGPETFKPAPRTMNISRYPNIALLRSIHEDNEVT